MQKTIISVVILMLVGYLHPLLSQSDTIPEVFPNPTTVNLVKTFGKNIFDLNGVQFLQPSVEVMNATSNARFYNKSFVPSKVNKPYFRVGIHGMYGLVPDAKKTYTPSVPNKELTTESLEFELTGISTFKFKYGTGDYDMATQKLNLNITDTAGFIYAAFLGMFYNGLKDGSLKVPKTAPTSLGSDNQKIIIPPGTLQKLFDSLSIDLPLVGDQRIAQYISDSLHKQIDTLLGKFPGFFSLPPGADMNSIFAAVPQLEIGSLFGTELLLRFIPKVNMGSTIGKFAFWGIGLKHSISQYFNEGDDPDDRYFDMAVQIVYQGTTLENKIGVTSSELEASASMWNFNVNASKHIARWLDVYSGFSYETINITSKYKYYISMETQWQLGLIDPIGPKVNNTKPSHARGENPETDPIEHPGDLLPQTTEVKLSDTNIKWTIGLSSDFGPVTIFADFNISKFNIFTGGVTYNF